MELNLVLERLKKRATKYNISDDEINQLTVAIDEFGIRAVRKEIKSLRANKTCPVIVHLAINNRYYFRHNVLKTYINNEVMYLTYIEQDVLWSKGYEYYGKDKEGNSHHANNSAQKYHSQPISLWIACGKECPDCGNLYIDLE